MRIAAIFLALALALPAAVQAATIDSPLAMGCEELSTQQGIRLFFRSGDGDGGEALMRKALASGSCKRMASGTTVKVEKRSGAFVCVSTGKAACLWVEAADIRP